MSNIFITLDYELYFGSNAGSQYNSIINPTQSLLEVLNKYGVKASFFVDSGYLLKLQESKNRFPALEKDYQEISEQLKSLAAKGHDLQLHIHPHWEDSLFDGEKWVMDTKRYRLHTFSEIEINSIFKRYKRVLQEYTENEIFTFRAGGWCIQPFSKLKKAFKKNNIWLDSTVFNNGRNKSETHFFDFKSAPNKTLWRFEDNPIVEETEGSFYEMPISSFRVSPFFFWKLAFAKKIGSTNHQSFGDGSPAKGSKWDKIRMLTMPSNTVASIDGYKASLLEKGFRKYIKKRDKEYFVIIGHPKALSNYSLEKLSDFLEKHYQDHNFLTYSNWANNIENGI